MTNKIDIGAALLMLACVLCLLAYVVGQRDGLEQRCVDVCLRAGGSDAMCYGECR